MRASTLPRYLLGSRSAILEIAASRWSILIGISLVLSAGIAREYDGEDLLHEPWHALRPLAASLASGTLLFVLVHAVVALRSKRPKESRPRLRVSYRVFLGLFWMTAPMAWLYAIPYERFLSPLDAVTVNLWTLAAVAAWRVVLMMRVIAVLYGVHTVAAFFIVMAFADLVVFVAMSVASPALINVMGGIQLPAREALIAKISTELLQLSVVSAPIWFVGAAAAALIIRPTWPSLPREQVQALPRGAFAVALLSIVAFVPALIAAQPEQINRRAVERLFRAGDVDEGLAFLSERSSSAFPPHWDPPPRTAYGESSPSLGAVRRAMEADLPADWVVEVYSAKIRWNVLRGFREWAGYTLAEAVEWIERSGKAESISEEDRAMAQFLLTHDPTLSAVDRTALERLLANPPANPTPSPRLPGFPATAVPPE